MRHGSRRSRPITRFSEQATIKWRSLGMARVGACWQAMAENESNPFPESPASRLLPCCCALPRCQARGASFPRRMTIGVPKEIKIGETRVSMTPSLCRRCVSLGAKVLIQKSAGITAGFTDDEYRAAGATLVGDAAKVWRAADLILKVKEPLSAEYDLLREGQTLFTYLHLAAGPELAKVLLQKNILGISYETVEGADGSFPLLKPMSQIAGRLSIQVGAYFLQSQHGGSGVLLGGIPGTMPGHVVVVGAGNSGAHAVQMAAGMGARVTVLDLDTRKLEALDTEYRGRPSPRPSARRARRNCP